MGIVPATYGIKSGGLSRADIIRIIEAEIAKAGTGTGLDAAGAQAIIAAMLKEGASVDLSLNTEKTELTISVDSDTLTVPVKIFAVSTAYTAGELVRGGTDNADIYLIRTNIAASNTQTLDQLTTAVRQIGGGGTGLTTAQASKLGVLPLKTHNVGRTIGASVTSSAHVVVNQSSIHIYADPDTDEEDRIKNCEEGHWIYISAEHVYRVSGVVSEASSENILVIPVSPIRREGTLSGAISLEFSPSVPKRFIDYLIASAPALSSPFIFASAVGGTGDATELTPNPAITDHADSAFLYLAENPNTGSATVAVSGLTAQAIVDSNGDALTANAIRKNDLILIKYDNTNTRYVLDNLSKRAPEDAERNIFRGGWVAGAYKAWEVVIRNRYLFRYTEDIPSTNTTPPESDSRAQRLIAAGPDDPVKITGNANVLTITKRDGTTSTITIEIAGMAEEVGRDLFIADYAVSDMAEQDADTDTEFDFTGETLVQGLAPQVTLDTTADTITINKKGAYAIAVEMKVTDEGTSGNSRLNAIIEYKMNGGTWHTLTSSVYVRPLTPNESVLHSSTDVLFAQNDVVKFRYHGDIGTSSATPRISISEISLRLFERPLKVNSTDDAIADKTAATPEENDLVTFADKSDSNKEKSTEIKNVLALLGVGIKDWTPLVTTGTQFLANASNTAVASATLAFSNSVYVPVPDGFLFYLEFEIGGATVEEAAFSIILPTLPQAVVPNQPFNLDSVHAVAYQKSGSGSVIEVEEDGDVRDFNIGLSLSEALTGSNKANFSVLGILKVTRNS